MQSHRYLTVLDCIYSEETQSFYVLDVLIYHNQEFLLCEASFRFYWIRSKFDEFDHSAVHAGNQYAFHHVDRADFDHPEEVDGMLSRYPLWEENRPALDGFLLYHKQAHYTHGKTPLVAWLLPWMVPEMLGYAVHAEYVKQRPTGCVKALDFMDDFDEQRKLGKRRHFFNAKKKRAGAAVEMELMSAEEASSWSGQGHKMEVQEELVDGRPSEGSDLDELDREQGETQDDGAEELLHQRQMAEDVNGDEETAIELLDNDRQLMTKRHKATITSKDGQQQVDQNKRISTLFKF